MLTEGDPFSAPRIKKYQKVSLTAKVLRL